MHWKRRIASSVRLERSSLAVPHLEEYGTNQLSIFGRRVLQRMINENAQFMTASQLERLVGLLNLDDGKGASTEWEIALSNSFSKFARVQYEPNLGGRSHPDL